MLLQPRIFNYKKKQKKRSLTFFKHISKLIYGSSGLLLLKSLQLTSEHLFKFKLFLKKAVKKTDKTRRFFWFNGFPQLPLTRKSTGSRMGKGKGKLKYWFIRLKGGIFLFEFKNLRSGRSNYFCKQISYKLNIPTKVIFANSNSFSFPLLNSKKFFWHIFW